MHPLKASHEGQKGYTTVFLIQEWVLLYSAGRKGLQSPPDFPLLYVADPVSPTSCVSATTALVTGNSDQPSSLPDFLQTRLQQ